MPSIILHFIVWLINTVKSVFTSKLSCIIVIAISIWQEKFRNHPDTARAVWEYIMDPISKTGRSDNIAQQGALAVVKVRFDEHAARALLKAPLMNPGVAPLEELINLNNHQGSDKEITEISAQNPV